MTSPADYIAAAAAQALSAYAAANSQPAGTFLHGSHTQASLEANHDPAPLLVLFDFTTNQKTTTDRVARADCTLYFADAKPGQGDSAEIEAAAVVRMTRLKQQFLMALDGNPMVEITNLRATPFHDAYAAKLTGVGMQFTLGVPAGSLALGCEPIVPGQPAPSLVPGISDQALLLGLLRNGTARLGHETSADYGSDHS